MSMYLIYSLLFSFLAFSLFSKCSCKKEEVLPSDPCKNKKEVTAEFEIVEVPGWVTSKWYYTDGDFITTSNVEFRAKEKNAEEYI